MYFIELQNRTQVMADAMDDSTTSASQIVLFADFDSANMARYEKVSKPSTSILNTSFLQTQHTTTTTPTINSSSNAKLTTTANGMSSCVL